MMAKEIDRPYLIDYAMRHFADLIPYDDPNYSERLQEMAEAYAESEINPNPEFEAYMKSLCEEHDKIIKEVNFGYDKE